MKVQTKIALLFTMICTFIIVALSSAIYHFANKKAFQDFYTRLELRATIAAKANLDSKEENITAYEKVRNEHLQRLPEEKEYIIKLDTLYNVAKSGLNLEFPPVFFEDLIKGKNASYRKGYHFYKGINYKTSTGEYAIVISAEHGYARNFLSDLKLILIIANLVSMIIIFSIGILFSKQILYPIRKITHEVNNINTTWLHNRLTIKQGKDEISELAITFNDMLDRLETSFESQNNFVSNASHELNTPLTSIIGEAEFALSKTRSIEQYQQGLQVILKQAEKLQNITKSLLELAQSGFTGNLSLETVKVSELLKNVEKVARSIYADCLLSINYSLQPADIEKLILTGNFHLLELCISNVLLNACKYSNGKNVTLALAVSDQYIIFIVEDKGIGIPEPDMPHLFDPFFRASNVKSSKGYGIGLPLAQKIVNLHHGFIHISSKVSEGTEVVIKIPKGK